MQIKDEKLTISARSSTNGLFEGVLPIELLKSQEVEIAFNAKYILDYVINVKPERIWLGVNDQFKPALLKEVGNSEHLHVIMPFRLNEG